MIIKNKSVFILGITKFDGPIESTSFTTAKFLAQDNDVYYVDFPYTVKDYFSRKDEYQFKTRKESFFSSQHCLLDTEIKRLKILILPPLLSINFLPENRMYRHVLDFNENIVVRRVNSVIERFQINDFIFINSFNFYYPNIGPKLKPNLLVYHCVDPLIIDYDKKHGLVSEEIIVEKSDLVVCTSKQLYREKSLLNENTFFIPNAADLDHSSNALNDSLPVHSSLKLIPKPIVGYFGNIERRMDFCLLHKVALNNPEKNFVFVGPTDDTYVPTEFKDLPNVFFIGIMPYKDMPAVLKGFDVSIIPFKKDAVSATIFPLKLFEYLGAGKPVVSTDFNPDLRDYTEDTVLYCQDYEDFSGALDVALGLHRPEDLEKRLKVAAENTWNKRLSDFSSLLYEYYNKNTEMRQI